MIMNYAIFINLGQTEVAGSGAESKNRIRKLLLKADD